MVRLQDPEGESRVDLQAGQSSSRLRLRTTSTRPVVLFTTYVWLDFWPRESKPCNARSFAKVWRRQVGLLGRGLASANGEARASKHSQVHRRGRQVKLPEVRNRRCTNRREQAEHAASGGTSRSLGRENRNFATPASAGGAACISGPGPVGPGSSSPGQAGGRLSSSRGKDGRCAEPGECAVPDP